MRIVDNLVAEHWPAFRNAVLDPPPAPAAQLRPPSDFVSWSCRVTPPFPAGRDLVYYAWAAGLAPSTLADGEFVVAAWARVIVDAVTRQVRFEPSPGKPARLGAQGVRPLRKDEEWLFTDAAAIEQQLVSAVAAGEPPSARVRQWYRLWIGFNRIARELRPLHPDFFASIGS